MDAGGRGDLKLYEGRLVDIAFLTEIGDLIDEMAGKNRRGRDQIRAYFDFKRTHIHITRLEAQSGVFTLLGQARVYFNQQVRALFDAGVLNGVTLRYLLSGTFSDYVLRRAQARDTL